MRLVLVQLAWAPGSATAALGRTRQQYFVTASAREQTQVYVWASDRSAKALVTRANVRLRLVRHCGRQQFHWVVGATLVVIGVANLHLVVEATAVLAAVLVVALAVALVPQAHGALELQVYRGATKRARAPIAHELLPCPRH